jgi:NADPH2:quinone reductase
MLAWTLAALGTAPQLQDLPDPRPGPGEVLVRVAAAGLNFADLLMLKGEYQQRPPLPFIPGMELAGTVAALGPGVTAPAVGTRVLAIPGHGALAGLVCLAADRLCPLPDGLPLDEAAGFAIAHGTSHLALDWKARLQPGETLVVTGAAGGVGLTAVAIGKRLGARVIALARGADRLAVARAAGADVLIDSDGEHGQGAALKDRLRAEGGVDVLYDTVGGAGFDAALRACRPDARLLAVGFASGAVPQVPANLLLVKNLTVIGFWFGAYLDLAPDRVRASLTQLLDWRAAGVLRPEAGQVLPFDALPQGLELLRSRRATGKVVIRVHDP